MNRNNVRPQAPCNIYVVASGAGQPRAVSTLGAAAPVAASWAAPHAGYSLGYDPLPPTPVCTALPNGTRRCCVTSPYDGSTHCAVLPGDNGGGNGDNGTGSGNNGGGNGSRPMVGAARPRYPPSECTPMVGGYRRCCTTVPPESGNGGDPEGGNNDPEGGGGENGGYERQGLPPTRGLGAVRSQPLPQQGGAGFSCTVTGSYVDGDLALKCRPH
ncbi:hypothetical protein psal_cds_672 [Pandoravirus salinus]|uniref:Uncharacterized protein n=1 Tax=Pandoravirus salinus TaxID=1349410 RepID=S4VW73_9VIRU|nr:hypothetical protein psal_cds_672 [Pandoravirus salinus]AGO84598.1 hypothetical protein psal_cds_672 [Pandoravirus salinus]